jgi:hypothetical protein
MSAKHIVVQGATVKCLYSVEPNTDKLKVLSQSELYANDKQGSDKLIATTKEIGQTCEKNTFGKCKLQPNGSGDFLPCQCVIQEWIEYYKNLTLSNNGKALTEDSKATCPIGGSGCISIEKHGQKAEGSKQQSRKSDDTAITAVNPVADNKKIKEDDEQQSGNEIE